MSHTPSPLRQRLFQIGTLVLVGVVTYISWSAVPPEGSARPGGIRAPSFEEAIFTVQSRMIVGAKVATVRAENPMEREVASAVSRSMAEALPTLVGETNTESESSRYLSRRRAILALYLRADEVAAPILRKLVSAQNRTEQEIEIDGLLNRLREQAARMKGNGELACPATDPNCHIRLSTADGELLQDMLGWHGKLALVAFTPDSPLSEELFRSALTAFHRFTVGVGIFTLLAGAGFVCFLAYAFLFIFGRLRSHYRQGPLDSALALEIFALYLFCYLALSRFIPLVADRLTAWGIPADRLFLSGIVILSLLALIFWPHLWGTSIGAVFDTLGIRLGGAGRAVQDLIIAPTYYLASWVMIGAVLIAYSLILQYFQIDISQGAHPVVPILLNSNDPGKQLLVVLLAVAIAPLVEEIMFRGALYVWLRARMSAFPSIAISSFIFALVHPQGPIGLVPLTAIGFMLALLREWRGALLPCILVHSLVNAGTMALVYLIMG